MITIRNIFKKNGRYGDLGITVHLKENEIYSVSMRTVSGHSLFANIHAICIMFPNLVTKNEEWTVIDGTTLHLYFLNSDERDEVYETISNKITEGNIDTKLTIILDNNHFVEIRESKELPKEPLSFNIGVSQ